ncbi:MAG: AraC-like DNA-binding protein [Flavobacterium sp.]|jgi:AraC-like DNA-binding protein
MVCYRCILVVKSEIEKLGLDYTTVELGEVIFKSTITSEQKTILTQNLEILGFEILNDSNSKTIERIKSVLIDLIQNKNNNINITISDYLKEKIDQDYSKISNLFSEVEGVSIEKYLINLKVEKIKELIVYNELTLSEIANVLHYSSSAHLSNQFKKVTGFSPSNFKKMKGNKRIKLNQL